MIDFRDYLNQDPLEIKLESFKGGAVPNSRILFAGAPPANYQPDYLNNKDHIPSEQDEKVMGDYLFLQQIPPQFWSAAWHWRNSLGPMKEAIKREANGDNHEVMSNFVNRLVIPQPAGGAIIILPTANSIFGNKIYTGIKNRIRVHERRPKLWSHHTSKDHPDFSDDGPGLADVNLNAKTRDELEPGQAHRDDYKDGLHGFDYSSPLLIDKDFHGEMVDSALRQEHGNNEKKIKSEKARLHINAAHSFAGMKTMKKQQATDSLHEMLRTNGLGFYGDPLHGQKAALDPLTGREVDVNHKPLADIDKEWGKNLKGDNMQHLRDIRLPVFERVIPYQEISYTNKVSAIKESRVALPIFNSTKFIPHLSNTLRKELKAQGVPGDFGSIEGIINAWDKIPPDIQEKIKTEQADLVDWAHYTNLKDLHQQRYPNKEIGYHHTVGFAPLHNALNFPETFMKPEDYEKAYKKYLGYTSDALPERELNINCDDNGKCIKGKIKAGLRGEVIAGLSSYLSWAHREEPQTFQMMNSLKNDVEDVVTIILALHLDDPQMGIYDPEVGLRNVRKEDYNEDEHSVARVNFAFRMFKSLSQAALTDVYEAKRQRKTKEKRVGQFTGKDGGKKDIEPSNKGYTKLSDEDIKVKPSRRDYERIHIAGKSLASAGWLLNRLETMPESGLKHLQGVGMLLTYRLDVMHKLGKQSPLLRNFDAEVNYFKQI